MASHDSELKFPEWLTDALFNELNELGFDTDISWDSLGRITLHIWKMSEAEKKELEELDRDILAARTLDDLERKGLI